MIDPSEFERCFRKWVSSVCGEEEAEEREIISIDGKTLRRSGSREQSPVHMVSAWANRKQLVLGQYAVEEKSNEITAVPALLEMLDIENCVVTADAMSCQKEIAKKIIDKKADYMIGLKDNQPNLRRDAAEYFADAWRDPRNYPAIQTIEAVEKGHGRVERRKYYLAADLAWLSEKEAWSGLRAFGAVCATVQTGERTAEETRYYYSGNEIIAGVILAMFCGCRVAAGKFARAVRAHWGIENSVHWCLDMTFHEDYNRTRKDHSAENMAVVRHIALDILKQYPEKISLARKRRRCSYDDALLAGVMPSVHA